MTTVAEPSVQSVTVGALLARLRGLIEHEFPGPIWVEGELSNCSYPSSGHIYFSLKDEREMDGRGQPIILPCTFFRHANQFVRFKLEDGLKVLCQGQVGIYEAGGKYQLKVARVEPKGIGALQLAFDQLKKRLAAEGLFDEVRKRAIPELPERVCIITSRTGSAVHDMVARLREHFHVIILPAKVQGEGAAREIAEAIRTANARNLADVLIVGRGGGSLEDMWCFNEELVARAIFSSEIPVISAVGHEDHWTIADYVADLRASTPTHAAQVLAHTRQQLLESAQMLTQQLVETMHAALGNEETRLDGLREQLRLLHPMVYIKEQTARVQEQLRHITQSTHYALDGLERHLQGLSGQLSLLHPLVQISEHTNRVEERLRHMTQGTHYALNSLERNLQGLVGRLDALSPLAVLARGYSITMTGPDNHVVSSAASITPGDELTTMLARGRVFSTVTGIEPDEGA